MQFLLFCMGLTLSLDRDHRNINNSDEESHLHNSSKGYMNTNRNEENIKTKGITTEQSKKEQL